MCLVSIGETTHIAGELSANFDNSGSYLGHNQPFRNTDIRSIAQVLGAIRRTQAE